MERLRYARTWRHAIEDITRLPFEAAMSSPTSPTKSFVHHRMAIHNSNLERSIPNDFTIEDIKGAAATIVIAGNDTVFSPPVLFPPPILTFPDRRHIDAPGIIPPQKPSRPIPRPFRNLLPPP